MRERSLAGSIPGIMQIQDRVVVKGFSGPVVFCQAGVCGKPAFYLFLSCDRTSVHGSVRNARSRVRSGARCFSLRSSGRRIAKGASAGQVVGDIQSEALALNQATARPVAVISMVGRRLSRPQRRD
jgi:hypothetical protein